MWPEKYEIARKNNRQKLHNDVIWGGRGKMFCLREGHLYWQLDGHHEKFTAQTCPIPEFFLKFQNYNLPESYKRKRPNLKRESVTFMSQQLFNILQQVSE